MATRFFFDSLAATLNALITVLEDAVETEAKYSFGPRSASRAYSSGLLLVGDVAEISAKLEALGGSTRFDD